MTDLNLDNDELMHLAIHYSEKGEHEKAIDYIKTVLKNDTNNPRAEYFLGAIYAELQMFDKAKDLISRSIKNGVNLITADFQLGLLYATSAEPEKAIEAWKPVREQPESNPLFLFQRGITALLQDRFDDCINDLNEGIKLNTFNKQLNVDMHGVINTVNEKLQATPSTNTSTEEKLKAGVSKGDSILLSAYKKKSYEE